MSETPLNLTAGAIQFINTSGTTGFLKGELTIGHDRQRRDLKAYTLHWGRNATSKIEPPSQISDYGPLDIGAEGAPQYVFNRPLTHHFDKQWNGETGAWEDRVTEVPVTATHLLVFVTDVDNREYLYACRPLQHHEHLLPAGATQLERYLSAASGRLGQLPVHLDSLWDPSRCPPQLLPWLAWATSVDIWFDSENDLEQESIRRRELIRQSAFVHQYKGTRAAIQQALHAFANISITLTEWWQQTPQGFPHTFKLDLLVNGNTLGAGSAELNRKLKQAIDAVKPVRSHYSFTISTVQTASMRLAASTEAVSYKRFNMAAVIS